MKFEIVNTVKEFNIVRFRYSILLFPVICLVFKICFSYMHYKMDIHHRVEVLDLKNKFPASKPEKAKLIPNGKITPRPGYTYIIKAESYFQNVILDFDPDAKPTGPSWYFLLNCVAISLIMFCALRKSSNERIFTKELLTGLSYLRYYIVFMIIAKSAQYIWFKNYIEKLSNHTVMYVSISKLDVLEYQFYLMLSGLLIHFIEKALKLQEEQDLTV